MKCKVEGCERKTMYTEQQVCQKHYFRFMRNGHYGLKKRDYQKYRRDGAKYRVHNGAGYCLIYAPWHPLSVKNYVYEHRFLVYKKYGDVLPPCELCGKEINWKTTHVDHIDKDVQNNVIDNLRPLCNPCNTRRDYPEQHTFKGRMAVTYNGVTMTPNEWSRESFVFVSHATIARRIRQGWSVEDALLTESATCKGQKTKALKAELSAQYE